MRWAPLLPSLGGRGSPRVEVEPSSTIDDRLKAYYESLRGSCPDMFFRTTTRAWHRYLRLPGETKQLRMYGAEEQYKILLCSLYKRMSRNYKTKLRKLLHAGKLSTVQQWYYTANGAVLPYLIGGGDDPKVVDEITHWCLEHCANNYAQFLARYKQCKKRMRKAYAEGKNVPFMRDMWTYLKHYKPECNATGPNELAQYVLLWTQTRATGLADGEMCRRSVEKLLNTTGVSSPPVQLDERVLLDICKPFAGVRGFKAHVSAGPSACLESPRQEGGQTGLLKTLCRTKVLHRSYDFKDLSYVEHKPRRVKSASDLISWAIQRAHEQPVLTRTVRVHAVVEPSKARSITASSYAMNVILGVIAHLFAPAMNWTGVKSGFKKDRHLWNFIHRTLHPQDIMWSELVDNKPVYALCFDLEESTDYGNISVGRAIWNALLWRVRAIPEFPLGLAKLAETLHLSKRAMLVPENGNYRLHIKRRGWFMGDYMTKIILTIAHEYVVRIERPLASDKVGDDSIVLDQDYARLQRIKAGIETAGFKRSEDDTWISTVFAHYCEEGALVPQGPRDTTSFQIRREEDSLSYIDYPRIRLLIPTVSETDAYSATNVGRFALLGKEARWAHQTNPRLYPAFKRASWYQHFLVPRDKDTLCPFIPVEIGGDGSYTDDPEHLRVIIERKSRSIDEVYHRLHQLMSGTWGFRLVRNDRLNNVVHKYHILAPKLHQMRGLLPPNSIVDPVTEERRIMMSSLRSHALMEPEQAMFRIAQSIYWKWIFRGKEPPNLSLEGERGGDFYGSPRPEVNLWAFLQQWRNPGFRFKDRTQYWIRADQLEISDPRSPQWGFNPHRIQMDESWVNANMTLFDRNIEDCLERVYSGQDLPESVRSRLNIYFESDAYIKAYFPRDPPRDLVLISKDMKLGLELLRLARGRTGREHRILLVPPVFWTIGRLEEILHLPLERWDIPFRNPLIIEDPGAIYWSHALDMWNFERVINGITVDWRFDSDLQVRRHRGRADAYNVHIAGYTSEAGVRIS